MAIHLAQKPGERAQTLIIHKLANFITDKNRKKITPGIHVSIVLKKDQRSGKLTEGIVKDWILAP